MFILYYFEQNCDDCRFEIIATSNTRESLKNKREEILRRSKIESEKLKNYHDATEARSKSVIREIEEFLLRNIKAVKPRGLPEYLGDDYWENSTKPENWHESSVRPKYNPALLDQKRKETIDYILKWKFFIFYKKTSSSQRNYAKEIEECLDLDLLSEPLLQITPDKVVVMPKIEFSAIYNYNYLFIEKVEHI